MFSPKLLIFSVLLSCASYKSNQKFEVKKDLKYGEDPRNIGDLYLSQNKQGPRPIVFTVHGGGWKGRSKSDMDSIAISLASHGFNVFNINYRLAPEFKHPAPIEDLKQAVEFIKKNYSKVINTQKIGLWGYSSGAQTTMIYGLNEKKSVKAIVGGGGPYDFTWWPQSPIIIPYMGYPRDENIRGWLEASPVTHLSKESPAIFLYHGKSDNLVEHSQMSAFDAQAKLLGVDIETHSVSFWGHMATFAFSSESVKKATQFLKKKLI
ncbi:alpha/beta hydrolase [bacterium]|nr:alpha/beta hydrolase [bacterium]